MASRERVCEACGATFLTQSTRARFCGASCRGKAHRGTVVLLANRTPRTPRAPSSAPSLVAVTERALGEAGVLDSPLGAATVLLAEAITDEATPPGAKATLSKEFRATLAAALAGAREGSRVDELRRRRDQLRAGR